MTWPFANLISEDAYSPSSPEICLGVEDGVSRVDVNGACFVCKSPLPTLQQNEEWPTESTWTTTVSKRGGKKNIYIYIHIRSFLTFCHKTPPTTWLPTKNSQGNTQTMVLLCPKLDCRAEWKAFKMASGVDKGEHLQFSRGELIGQRRGQAMAINGWSSFGKFSIYGSLTLVDDHSWPWSCRLTSWVTFSSFVLTWSLTSLVAMALIGENIHRWHGLEKVSAGHLKLREVQRVWRRKKLLPYIYIYNTYSMNIYNMYAFQKKSVYIYIYILYACASYIRMNAWICKCFFRSSYDHIAI